MKQQAVLRHIAGYLAGFSMMDESCYPLYAVRSTLSVTGYFPFGGAERNLVVVCCIHRPKRRL